MYILTIEANPEKTTLESHIRIINDLDKLNEYYRYLNCRCIDMATIVVDGHPYDVICDDEALFRKPLIPSLYISEDQVFFGNIAFVRHNEEGNPVSLNREDMIRLLDFIDRQKERLYRWTERQLQQKQKMSA